MSTKPDINVVSSQSNLTNQAVNVDKSTVDDNKTKQCNPALHEQQYGCSKAKSFRGEEVLHERRQQQHAPPEQTTDTDMRYGTGQAHRSTGNQKPAARRK